MEILFIKPLLGEGGGVKWVFSLARQLTKRGHSIKFVYYKERGITTREARSLAEEAGVLLIKERGFKPPRGMPLTYRLDRVLKYINDSDVWYCFNEPPNSLIFSALKDLGGVHAIKRPGVLGFHTTFMKFRATSKIYAYLIKSYITRKFECIHVLNEQMKRFFLTSLSSHKVFLIPNGIDVQQFPEAKCEGNKFTVIWVGRFYKEKGVELLRQIIEKIEKRKSGMNIEFLLVGGGPLKHVAERLSKKYSFVQYLGYVMHKKLKRLYSEACLYLLTSRVEGMPLSLLEASAAGLPCVGSCIPGVIEVVEKTGTGRLVDLKQPNCAEAFVNAITSYYEVWAENSAEYRSLIRRTRINTAHHFGWETLASALESMFLTAINNYHQ